VPGFADVADEHVADVMEKGVNINTCENVFHELAKHKTKSSKSAVDFKSAFANINTTIASIRSEIAGKPKKEEMYVDMSRCSDHINWGSGRKHNACDYDDDNDRDTIWTASNRAKARVHGRQPGHLVNSLLQSAYTKKRNVLRPPGL
jgi:hypothetical protein